MTPCPHCQLVVHTLVPISELTESREGSEEEEEEEEGETDTDDEVWERSSTAPVQSYRCLDFLVMF